MLYTLITFALVFFTCLLFLPKFKRFIEQQSVAFNFLLTMVATLVGVLLAIAISNYEADKKEQEDVVRLIDASITSIESCAGYTQALLEHAEQRDRALVPCNGLRGFLLLRDNGLDGQCGEQVAPSARSMKTSQ